MTTVATAPQPLSTADPLRLSVLGCFALRLGNRSLRASRGTQRLLTYLAIHHGRASRVAAAATLWPEATDSRAAASLRSALWRLPSPPDRPLVHAGPATLMLGAGTRVDLHEVERRAAALLRAGDGDAPPPLGPPELSEDLLPDWPEEWLLSAREQFRQVRLRALEALCDRHRRAGRLDAALEAGMAAVAGEPLRESAHRMLVRVHLADGNTAEALRQYELYRQLLRAELGIAPSARFRNLLAPLLRRPLDGAVHGGGATPARRPVPGEGVALDR